MIEKGKRLFLSGIVLFIISAVGLVSNKDTDFFYLFMITVSMVIISLTNFMFYKNGKG